MDEEQHQQQQLPPVSTYDPQAPIKRKGVLISMLTGRPMPIKESDTFGRCRAVAEFEKLNRVGEGTYGIVCEWICR